MNRSLNFPIEAEQLIPHRPPLRLIDRLLSYDGLEGVVESTLLSGSIGLEEDGSIIQAAMVELIAQAFATVKGYADFLEGKSVKKGFLVGVKQFLFQRAAFGNKRLLIYITKTGETDEFAMAEGRVTCGEEVVASGNLMVWIPREV
jgi:3-hydroxyacyl-[acyl-carrier-protein] dehydratase